MDEVTPDSAEMLLDDGEHAVRSSVPGSLWQLTVKPGDSVSEGDVVAVIESMKMEIPLHSTVSGKVVRSLCEPGTSLATGQVLLVIREHVS